ncbi:MAG: TolC family protein [Taibaiella sp.]|nr:TolC family protein [Taibaiella sp.]
MRIPNFAVGKLALVCVASLLTRIECAGQDTLRVDLATADKLFADRNLSLIAAQLNIDAKKAGEIQARLYPNPEVAAEVNAIDPQNRKYFHTGTSGEIAGSVQQLIILGGKRRKEIEIAKGSTRVAELELADLLRTLRRQLHTSLYSIYFDGLTLHKYDNQLHVLDTIIAGYEIQVRKGNMAPKELVRLKTVYLGLNNDKSDLLESMRKDEETVKILLRTASPVRPLDLLIGGANAEKVPGLDSLTRIAVDARPDLKIAQLDQEIASLNLRYQKSLATPDMTVGSSYDRAGGAFTNQVNLTLGMPIPLWHRNQGNIRAAKNGMEQASVNRELAITQAEAEVATAWGNMTRSLAELEKARQLYDSDFAEVLHGMTENFRKHNISIIEFVDFFEAYNESLAAMNRIRKRVAVCAEEINYVTASSIY